MTVLISVCLMWKGNSLNFFIELNADDEQLDFPLVYASARSGIAKLHMNDEGKDLQLLFDTILERIPASGR